MSKIAVLGSGPVGQALADGFLRHGHDVMRGSRDAGKLAEWKEKAGAKAQIGTFADAARWGELVVLAVKGNVAEQVLEQIAPAIAGKTVIDTTNPLADAPPVNGVLRYFTNLDESLMERLQKKVPQARLVKAFNSVANPFMADPKFPGGPPTMFICGNDAGAKAEVSKLLEELGWEPSDMGMMESARAIEPLCMLYCIRGIAQGQWNHAFKLLRLQ